MTPTPKPPRLDPRILADAASLAEALDALTRDDRRMQRHVREILHQQKRLQELSEDADDIWLAYLSVEAAINGRLVDLVGRIARWAFDAGRAFERAGGRSS